MGEWKKWKKWLNPDYAFSNNGEKVKRIVKILFKIQLASIFIGAAFGVFFFLVQTAEGNFKQVWLIPIIVAIVALCAPFLTYCSYCLLYGFGELIANSYGKNSDSIIEPVNEKNAQPQSLPQQPFNCYSCGGTVNFGDAFCSTCGAAFDWNQK